MKKLLFYLATFYVAFFISCSDIDPHIDVDPQPDINSLLILNEGSINQNNSTLAKYNSSTGALERNYFNLINKRGLGDAGNDMILYGSKLYIVINASGTIEVVEASSGISLQQIPMKTKDGNSKEPRQIAAHGGKVYVTSFDDTVTRIDTTTLSVEATITVGMDPEGITVSNGKIYVANSGGLNFLNGYNNTMTIIDIASFKEIDEIEVGVNPANLAADNRGNIYISALGDYNNNPAVFQKLNPHTNTVTTIEGISSPGRFKIHDNKAYIIQGSFGKPYNVLVYDCLNEEIITENFITGDMEIGVIYSLSIDKNTGDLFIMESDYTVPGNVYCFDKEGKLKYKIDAVGLNPNTVIAF